MTNPNEPAFPSEADSSLVSALAYRGLTKREYFAAMAMQGILAHSCGMEWTKANDDKLGVSALRAADALIVALKD